jgi:hypothetical protein
MKSHSVQKLADKPVIIVTLTNPTKTQHTEHTLRQIDACREAKTVYLIYDVTPLKLSSDELSQLMCSVQADLLAEAANASLKFIVIASEGHVQRAAEHDPAQEAKFALFPSLNQALTYTASKLVHSNGKH